MLQRAHLFNLFNSYAFKIALKYTTFIVIKPQYTRYTTDIKFTTGNTVQISNTHKTLLDNTGCHSVGNGLQNVQPFMDCPNVFYNVVFYSCNLPCSYCSYSVFLSFKIIHLKTKVSKALNAKAKCM